MTTSRRILPQGALWIGLGAAALLGVIPDRTGHPWCTLPWKRPSGTPAGR